jgi:vancomycin permeability regulator SanA
MMRLLKKPILTFSNERRIFVQHQSHIMTQTVVLKLIKNDESRLAVVSSSRLSRLLVSDLTSLDPQPRFYGLSIRWILTGGYSCLILSGS